MEMYEYITQQHWLLDWLEPTKISVFRCLQASCCSAEDPNWLAYFIRGSGGSTSSSRRCKLRRAGKSRRAPGGYHLLGLRSKCCKTHQRLSHHDPEWANTLARLVPAYCSCIPRSCIGMNHISVDIGPMPRIRNIRVGPENGPITIDPYWWFQIYSTVHFHPDHVRWWCQLTLNLGWIETAQICFQIFTTFPCSRKILVKPQLLESPIVHSPIESHYNPMKSFYNSI